MSLLVPFRVFEFSESVATSIVMATGESSAALTAAKLEEVLKAVRDVETKSFQR